MDPLTDNDSSNMGVTRYEGFQFVLLLYIPKRWRVYVAYIITMGTTDSSKTMEEAVQRLQWLLPELNLEWKGFALTTNIKDVEYVYYD